MEYTDLSAYASVYFSDWHPNGAPLSDTFLTFPFRYAITKKDLELFCTRHQHTSFSFRWFLPSESKIYIHRGNRCFFCISVNQKTDIHSVTVFFYEDWKNLRDKPEEILSSILERWTGHGAVLTMSDVHCHVVPNVDDGSSSLEMSLQMIESAYEQGVRSMICSSHSWGNMSSYKENFEKLAGIVKEMQLDISLYPGCEIECSEDWIPEILHGVSAKTYMTPGASKFMMLEFDPDASATEILRCVKRLTEVAAPPANRVIIAHTERYRNLRNDPNAIKLLRIWGCLFQVNAYSLVKEHNQNIKSFARKLLSARLVTFIGSDAHRMDHRPPDVADGIRYLYDTCDVSYANRVSFENASLLMTGYEFPNG